MHASEFKRRDLFFWAILIEGGLVAAALLLGWLCGYPVWDRLRWSFWAFLDGIIVCLPMLAGLFICLRWPLGPLARIKALADDIVRPMFARCTAVDVLIICLLAGIGEELFFRGFLQPVILDWTQETWSAIVLAAIIFGLAHFISPAYFVLATVAGIYLGAVAHWKENVLEAIVAHALYDFVALIYLVKTIKTDQHTETALAP